MKVFVPYSEQLARRLQADASDLVPFQLDYRCLRAGRTTTDARQKRLRFCPDEAPAASGDVPAASESDTRLQ